MTDRPPQDRIVTPEAVALRVDVAGIGSRLIAAFVDALVQAAILLVFALVFVNDDSVFGIGGSGGVAIFVTVVFLVVWGYFPLFEGLGGGRTPGKRVQKLRVIRADGQPAGWGPIVVRNLLRIVDFLPMYYAAGIVAMLASKRSQRIGDMAAGTIVVRDRAAPTPSVIAAVSPTVASFARKLDTTGLNEREFDVARSYVQRRATLEPRAREELARRIAETLRARVPDVDGVYANDEVFIEATVHAYRERFAAGRPQSATEPPPYESR